VGAVIPDAYANADSNAHANQHLNHNHNRDLHRIRNAQRHGYGVAHTFTDQYRRAVACTHQHSDAHFHTYSNIQPGSLAVRNV
jgi:hypothetical protein